MSRLLTWTGAIVVVVASLGFAALNSGHRVTLRLGFVTLYGVPLTAVAFASVIAGMLVMLVAGVHSDLKVRRILRARLAEEDLRERARFVDRSQQDLFETRGLEAPRSSEGAFGAPRATESPFGSPRPTGSPFEPPTIEGERED